MNRERAFAIAWRVAILALPWQTRWIFSTPTINGFPWEQGTVAVYASWIVIGIALLFGLANIQPQPSQPKPLKHRIVRSAPFILLVIASLFTVSPVTTVLWWSHVLILAAFAWVLWRNRVSAHVLAAWFVIALVPHALIGVWQFATQHVSASTVLGIAEQLSWQSGVSVVETTIERVLRAYGGFPHPNIFGAWLVVAMVLLPNIIRRSGSVVRQQAWIICSALLAMALVLTLSRGAWIAAAVGGTVAFIAAWKKCASGKQQAALLAALVAVIAIVGCAAYVERDAVLTRFQSSARLEQWSIEQRTSSLKDGLAAWQQRPLTGWGPGAALMGIIAIRPASPVAPEPPHIIPLVAAVETGILGLLSFIALAGLLIWHLIRTKRFIAALPVLFAMGVLMLTDHFLWTLWAGQALLIILILLVLDVDP